MPDSDSSGFSLPAWVKQPEHLATASGDQGSESTPESDLASSRAPSNLQGAARDNEPAGPFETSKHDPVTTLLTQSKVVEQAGQVPVFLPETLTSSRCLVEIDSAGSTHDLAGDSGAVGRFAVKDAGGTPLMLLDLKGQIYSMKVVPSAAMLCVVNIKQTEAKMEAMLSEYVQLQTTTWSDATQEQDLRNLMADDDENYQQDDATEAGTKPSVAAAEKQSAAKPKPRLASKGTAKASGSKPPAKKRQKQLK